MPKCQKTDTPHKKGHSHREGESWQITTPYNNV